MATTQTLEGISAQILQNQKDLPAAIAANKAAGAAGANENAAAVAGASLFQFDFIVASKWHYLVGHVRA